MRRKEGGGGKGNGFRRWYSMCVTWMKGGVAVDMEMEMEMDAYGTVEEGEIGKERERERRKDSLRLGEGKSWNTKRNDGPWTMTRVAVSFGARKGLLVVSIGIIILCDVP